MKTTEYYMNIALEEAEKAAKKDEVPVGCVIIDGEGKILARTHNRKVELNDATKHAEILAINEACIKLGTWYLNECDMYVTLEPCLMCTGAIINSRIKNLYYATEEPKGGAIVSSLNIKDVKNLNHYPNVCSGIKKEEASELLKKFFRSKRKH